MSQSHSRSECPINRAVELLGDRWTLLVLRDIVFRGHGHFRALLDGSDERISTSVLSDRLNALVEHGILRRESCPGHRQKSIFQLTEAGQALIPILGQLKEWAIRHCDCAETDWDACQDPSVQAVTRAKAAECCGDDGLAGKEGQDETSIPVA